MELVSTDLAEYTSDDWLTPPIIYDAFDEMGGVGLDPCSNPASRVDARFRFIHEAHERIVQSSWARYTGQVLRGKDGLLDSWDGYGLVYVNPPYSDPAPWVEKAAHEGAEVVLLLPAATGTRWWHKYVKMADVILFWEGRIKFLDPLDGKPKHPARGDSALVYWGFRTELFKQVFAGCGWFVNGE